MVTLRENRTIFRRKKVKSFRKYIEKRWGSKRYFFKVLRARIFRRKKRAENVRRLRRRIHSSSLKRRIFRRLRFKSFLFDFSRLTMSALRVQKFIFKYHRRRKTKIWKLIFRKYARKFLQKFSRMRFKRRSIFKFIFRYYRVFGLRSFCKKIIKYARLKYNLARKKKIYIEDKNKPIKYVAKWNRIKSLSYLNYLLSRLITLGRRRKAERFYIQFLTILKFMHKSNYMKAFFNALNKIRPLILYKTIYKSGKKYKIPALISTDKSYKMAINWLVLSAKNNSDLSKSMPLLITNTLNNTGVLIKQRKEYHITSFENKSYVYLLKHLRGGFV